MAITGLLLTSAVASAGPTTPYPGCSQLQITTGTCTGPPLPPATGSDDPGGNETIDQPIPKPGRRFGFSSNLSFQIPAAMRFPVTPAQETSLGQTAGADSARVSAPWKYLQYEATSPLFGPTRTANDSAEIKRIDDRYDELVARGMTPVIIAQHAPKWASRFASCPLGDVSCNAYSQQHGWDDVYFPDAAHLPQWKAFVEALTRRYPLAVIEGWNEPNVCYGETGAAAGWCGQQWTPGPEEFNSINCAAYQAVKAAAPGRTFVGPSLLLSGAARYDFVNRVFYAGGKNCWDVYNVHIYFNGESTFGTGTAFASNINRVRGLKSYYGDTDPIWLTESGWATAGTGWEATVTEAVQADAAARLYNKVMSLPDVTGLFFHTLRDAPAPDLQDSGDIERYYGFLHEDSTPKPAYCMFVARSGHTYAGC